MQTTHGTTIEVGMVEHQTRAPDGGLNLSPVPADRYAVIDLSYGAFSARIALTADEADELAASVSDVADSLR